ncbi:uncharacterized protein [Watersipora subatra]|uniref:uncharacterized protein n=1 Tax=Watersipora subatra TaxID=2589382 RepID=UPI00355C053E
MLLEVLLTIFVIYLIYNYCFGGSKNGHSKSRLWTMYGNTSFEAIADKFTSVEDVTEAIRKCGLESSNLIFGIDYTLSNLTQGKLTFNQKSLHYLDETTQNPYQQVISIIGETLSSFDEDNIIPAFGFGDLNTKDHSVFPLSPEGYCHGVDGVLAAYNSVTQRVRMSGPTSFVPLIRRAVDIVAQTRSYHILVIIADGQVSNERSNIEAIVEASNYPLSIIMVGVGDGPWDMMKTFDDQLPARKFDNFQFVEFNRIVTNKSSFRNPSSAFALQALMEIPDQFVTMRRLGMIG